MQVKGSCDAQPLNEEDPFHLIVKKKEKKEKERERDISAPSLQTFSFFMIKGAQPMQKHH